MLKVYIVDDDISVVKILENIIEDCDLGDVVGYSLGGEDTVNDILLSDPDIVLIDLLMPDKDGIEIVKDIREEDNNIKFIMISQVNTKEMIGNAYESGIEFFINKPINIIEVKNIMEKLSEKIKMEKILTQIESVVKKDDQKSIEKISKNPVLDVITNIKKILNKLGILGEKGGEDIIRICQYLLKTKTSIFDYKIKDLCNLLAEDNQKAMEQRIRRAINKGLVNLANIGMEDYMNSTFTKYSNSIYNFQDVKAQMDYIRGKRKTGGKINVKKFIDNIMAYQEIGDM
ncbi:DNA-binding domain-containing protein [Clostridiisalibacter paucivorans]|uniref:DNA-binding domain-containing protein n=1 Tax=Clostridiisalibacter paucivorans TaxID=408753 RepID=UPI0004795F1F|nr:DNA-binding domain-containing protein [Clostridiisalibacter paucivorans]